MSRPEGEAAAGGRGAVQIALAGVMFMIVAQSAPARAAPAAPEELGQLLSRVEAILAARRAPGAGLALVTADGLSWAGGVGVADLATGAPVSADTVFRGGSLSKSITALLIMRLVEEGRLSLDERVGDLAPEVQLDNPWEAERPVRLAHLLEHTAGFDFLRWNEWFDEAPGARPLREALALNPRSRRSRWPPGSRVSYSNEGYLVAGYLAEKVTGRIFDEAIREEVLQPLGMDGTAFWLTPALCPLLAQGYRAPGRPARYQEDLMRPAAGILTTPRDMLRYLRFWLGRGALDGRRLLSEASVDRIETRMTLESGGPDEQYGLGNGGSQRGGWVLRGHGGGTYGFAAGFNYVPDARAGWAVLLNSEDVGVRAEIERELLRFVTAGRTPPAPAPRATAPGDVEGLAGFYRDTTPGEAVASAWVALGGLEVERDAQGLTARYGPVDGPRSLIAGGEQGERLVPLGGDLFRREGEPISSLRFVRGADGVGQAVVTAGGVLERAPRGRVALERGLLVAGLLVALAGAALAAPAALLAWRSGAWPAAVLALSAVPGGCLAVSWALFRRWPDRLGVFGPASAAVMLLGWTFAACAIALVAAAVLAPREVGLLPRLHAAVVGLASVGLTTFAALAGWLGLRTWRW